MSLAEIVLWRALRKQQTGFKFRKQHPAGDFSLDFACLKARLAIEVDGEAHDRGTNPARDEARDEWLANQGFRTLRIPAREVLADVNAVVTHILNHCQPQSSPARGGGPRAQRVVEGLARSPEQPLHQPSAGPPPPAGEDL